MIKSKLINYLFIIGLVANLIFPRIVIQGINIYPIYPISAVMLVLWVYITLEKQFQVAVNKSIYYPLLILSSILISFIIPAIIFTTEISFKYFIYDVLVFLIMLPFFLIMNHLDITQEDIDKAINFCFFIFCTVGILQWIGYSPAVTLYAFDIHAHSALAGWRLTLTGSDPNVGALVASFFIFYFFVKFLYGKSIISLTYLFIALALLLKTQGRTTMVGVSIVMVFSLLFLVKIRVLYRILILTIGTIAVIYFVQQFDLLYVITGLDTLQEGNNNSVNTRLDNAKFAIDNFKASPIIGWGSSLEQFSSVRILDSEILIILQRYGLYGLFIIAHIIYKIIFTGLNYRHTRYGIFLIMMITSLLFNMITNVVFFGAQSASLILFLIYIRYYLHTYEKNYISPPSST